MSIEKLEFSDFFNRWKNRIGSERKGERNGETTVFSKGERLDKFSDTETDGRRHSHTLILYVCTYKIHRKIIVCNRIKIRKKNKTFYVSP